MMKTIIYHEYGTTDVLKLEEIEKPKPQDDEILVKIFASAVNVGDFVAIRGTPYIMRLMFGLRKPKTGALGEDIAGVVETVGKDVTQFKPGDEVFGWGRNTFAEYTCAKADNFTRKPENISLEEAGATGVSALTALQGIKTYGKVQSGQKVLINGASGGVGSFAVQIAKAYGAEVTAVCSTRNLEMVKELGADHVIDYTKENFTQNGQQYDLILDNVGNHRFSDYKRVLTPQGVVISNYGAHSEGQWLGPMVAIAKIAIRSMFSNQQGSPFLAVPSREDYETMTELIEAGKMTPFIEKTYPLAETAKAFSHVGTGRTRGKVVVTMANNKG